jgi:hypothetical protein
MKTHDARAETTSQRQPAAADPVRPARSALGDSKASMQAAIDQSPRVLAQQQSLQAAFGGALQRKARKPSHLQRPASHQTPTIGNGSAAPIQGRFGFEVELPMLLVHKKNRNVPSLAGGGALAMNGVPRDAARLAGSTDLHAGPECHVNVDHSSSLNPLFTEELQKYATDNGLNANGLASLLAFRNTLMPYGASIVEVVTDAWDESALSRPAARAKVCTTIDWISALFDQIAGHQQVALGAYHIGSSSPEADTFQPRLGYFHATYGVKLSQVPRLFEETTRQKGRLRKYAKKNLTQGEHANNLQRTFNSIGAAQAALKQIKKEWPRTSGSKGWPAGAEATFLGFLTLLTNYLLMFKANNGANLAKQMVGMHYYKSDLFDVAKTLPARIRKPLKKNAVLRDATIAAIGDAVGFAVNDDLGGPLNGTSLTGYLLAIFTDQGVISSQNGDDLRDPVLEGSINPHSRKLGPEPVGPAGEQEQGVVIENRHLEYLDPGYGEKLDESERQRNEDVEAYGDPKDGIDTRTQHEKAMFDSLAAREEGPAKRPIGEWEGIMMAIYDMIRAINRR